jgi:hypothetical protein
MVGCHTGTRTEKVSTSGSFDKYAVQGYAHGNPVSYGVYHFQVIGDMRTRTMETETDCTHQWYACDSPKTLGLAPSLITTLKVLSLETSVKADRCVAAWHWRLT